VILQQKPDLFDDECCTRALIPTISECLMNRPDCCHVFQFGKSYLCHYHRHIALRVPLSRKIVQSRP
jgi:hypothetical protein